MAKYQALVTGAHGIIGHNLVQELALRRDWDVTALGRREEAPAAGVGYRRVDLGDSHAVRAALADAGAITHLFFAAFQGAADPLGEIAANVAILANTLDALRGAGARLQRVVIYQGGKAYGALHGSVRTPARESDPRVPGPLFYHDQEDLLYARGAAEGFATTVLRPDFVQGIGFGSFVNVVHTVAGYAAVCRKLGLPLHFPGGPAAFEALIQLTDAQLLARGAIWAALEPHGNDVTYNITNGDLFRWSHVWPRVAEWFGLPVGRPLHVDLDLFMRSRGEAAWAELRREHGLVVDLHQLQDWRQTQVLSSSVELHSSTIRIRQAGFQDCLDSEDRLIALFEEMRQRKYIP